MNFQMGAKQTLETFFFSLCCHFSDRLASHRSPMKTSQSAPHLSHHFFFNLYCFFSPRFFRAANPRWVSQTWPAVRVPPLSRRSARPPRRRSSWASCTTPPRGASRWRSSKASTSKTWPPTSHPVSTLSSAFQSPLQQNKKSLRNYGKYFVQSYGLFTCGCSFSLKKKKKKSIKCVFLF